MLPVIEFALDNAVHASTGFTPFYVNIPTHPRVPLTLPLRGSGIGGGESSDKLAEINPTTMQKQASAFLATRLSVLRHARDAMSGARTNKNNNLMLKPEDILILMKLETKSY